MYSVNFSISLLLFWLKGKVEVDSRFVKINIPNTILGVVPLGSDQQNIPLKNISSATISSRFYFLRIIIGVIIMLLGLGSMGDSFLLGLIFLIIGFAIAGGGIQTTLEIQRAGNPYQINVPFYEKSKVQELNDAIHSALVADTDKTDLNLFFDRKEVQ